MSRSCAVFALVIVALMFFSAPAMAQQPPVMLDDLIVLSQSGVSDDTILVFLGTRPLGFVPQAADVARLRAVGVSDRVIQVLLQRSAALPVPPFVYGAPVEPYPYPPAYYRSYYGPYYGTVVVAGIGLPRRGYGHHVVPHRLAGLTVYHGSTFVPRGAVRIGAAHAVRYTVPARHGIAGHGVTTISHGLAGHAPLSGGHVLSAGHAVSAGHGFAGVSRGHGHGAGH